VDLADIVNQSEQVPLYIHFTFGTQGESIHVFMYTDVGKDRLDNCEPPRVDLLARFAVDLGFHQIDQVRLTRVHLNRKIPARSVGLAQTARAQRTGGTVFGAGLVDIIRAVTIELVARMTLQFFSVRTKIDALAFIIRKISGGEGTWLEVRSLPAVDAILEALLIGKAWISFSELDIWDEGIDLCTTSDC